MSNYTQNTDFTPKDTLDSGDPAKKILGADLDGEFAELESVSVTKADLASPALTGTPTIDGNPTVQVISGEWTPGYTGFSADPSGDWSYHIQQWGTSGDGQALVTLVPQFNAVTSGTSNSSGGWQVTGLPAAVQPNATMNVVVAAIDNGVSIGARALISGSTITFFILDSGAWTASGTKGLQAGTQITYILNNGG